MLRPLYESSKIVAQKMTMAVSASQHNACMITVCFSLTSKLMHHDLQYEGIASHKANCSRDKW